MTSPNRPLPTREFGRRRLAPSFVVSALAHALLLALAILLARHPAEAPEWLPAPSFDMVFEGGQTAKPTIPAPEPHAATKTPESKPTPAPAPQLAPPQQAPPPPPMVAPAPVPVPPPEKLTLPPRAPSAAPRPATPHPAPARPSAPPAFPAPMAFSLGGPASPPAERRRLGRGIDLSLGSGVVGAENTKIFGRSDSKEVGPDWYNRFAAWWDRHGYYPPQAGRNGEEGQVVLDMVVLRSGRVARVALASGSGSQWLDMAALGVFRDATLPPLPSDAAPSVPITLTIHYQIMR
jgi:periplasmic protein TonB